MKRTIKDFIFEKSLLFLALLTLAGLAGIVWFLFKEGMPVLETISLKHFLTGHDWYPTEDPPSFGIFPLIIGSVSVTLLAAVMAGSSALSAYLKLLRQDCGPFLNRSSNFWRQCLPL